MYGVLGKFNYEINIAGRLKLELHIEPLHNAKWRYEHQQRDYDRFFNNVTEVEPNLDGVKILAWGHIKDSRKRGINIFLLKKTDDIYGNWVMLFNRNSAFNQNPRSPEPFAFEISEFQRELPSIRAMHIYSSEIEPFTIEKLVDFINQGF